MRRLPKFIRVAGLKVNIILGDNLTFDHVDDAGDHSPHSVEVWGIYSPTGPNIQLDRESGSERLKITLVHESLHALVDAAHIQLSNDDEETLVGRLAPLVLDYIRANRGAVAYLQES